MWYNPVDQYVVKQNFVINIFFTRVDCGREEMRGCKHTTVLAVLSMVTDLKITNRVHW